jgi:hypothetical protein
MLQTGKSMQAGEIVATEITAIKIATQSDERCKRYHYVLNRHYAGGMLSELRDRPLEVCHN